MMFLMNCIDYYTVVCSMYRYIAYTFCFDGIFSPIIPLNRGITVFSLLWGIKLYFYVENVE
jgi:hypothetical protein